MDNKMDYLHKKKNVINKTQQLYKRESIKINAREF